MAQSSSDLNAIKVGVVTDTSGPLAPLGTANANIATLVVDDINASGGLLGRKLQLFIEDSETTDSAAETKARKLVKDIKVDVLLGGIYSSTRQAIKKAAVEEAGKLYIYPEQYEGQESHPLIFCTGPVPAQQVESMIPWLMKQTGAKKFYCPSADYIWPHVLNKSLRQVVTANGGSIVGEEYFPLDHADYKATIDKINSSGADVVFNTTVPPGVAPFLAQLHESGFAKRGGKLVCTYFEENILGLFPPAMVEGLYGCLDYYLAVSDPFSRELLSKYNARFPGSSKFTGGSAATGLYRGLKLWESAVKEAGSLKQDDVINALDHAKIDKGPGGPAQMVPGQHHVRMNMYIAQVKHNNFEIVQSLSAIDPKEPVVKR